MVRYAFDGVRLTVDRTLQKKQRPIVGGIAINDSCNLSCIHCAVSNRNIPDMSMRQVRTGLHGLRDMGIGTLFIEGGEPFLWRDGPQSLQDIIEEARRIGFHSIIVYTNGTFPIETGADSVFVSLDGLRETNNKIRGPVYDTILSNITASGHPKIVVNFTINAINCDEIEAFCEEILKMDRIRGVFFYFHTPYPDRSDGLFVQQDRKVEIINRILRLKSLGFRILNSRPGLLGARNNSWPRPTSLCYIYADNKLYQCCRAIGYDEICRNCGYLGYAELHYISRLNLAAMSAAAACVSRRR